MTLPPGQFGLQPAENAPAPAPEPEQPHYTVTGVVQGPNSVAIVADLRDGEPIGRRWRTMRM